LAANYLAGHGYTILHRNYRSKSGEIDIIARQGDTLVFVEVKTRRTNTFGSPAAAVTARKQLQISRVAQEFLAKENLFDTDARFDVVSVFSPDRDNVQVEVITNAFDLNHFG
jgi:putative endonuclease